MSDGVDASPAGVEEELTFEHEKDVEIVVLFDATFLRLDGACLLGSLRGGRDRRRSAAGARSRRITQYHDRVIDVVVDRNCLLLLLVVVVLGNERYGGGGGEGWRRRR